MKISDLKSVNNKLAKQLLIDGWTIELLATTTAKILASGIEGLGIIRAKRVVAEAQKLVNKSGLKKSKLPTWIDPATFSLKFPIAKMSSRVRRAKASKAKNQ